MSVYLNCQHLVVVVLETLCIPKSSSCIRIKFRKNYVVGLLVGGEVGWGVGTGVGTGVGWAVGLPVVLFEQIISHKSLIVKIEKWRDERIAKNKTNSAKLTRKMSEYS